MFSIGELAILSSIIFLLIIQFLFLRLFNYKILQLKELVQNLEKSATIENTQEGISSEFLNQLGFKTDQMKKPVVHVYHVSTGKKEVVPICK